MAATLDSLTSLPERFVAKVEPSPDGCLLWTGPIQRGGYGYIKWRVDGEWKHARAHRLAYEAARGPIPDGLEIDHLCKVRNCVNPDHLRAVTHVENMRNAENWQTRKTHAPCGHPLTVVTGGRRGCPDCLRKRTAEAMRRYRLRKAMEG